MAVAANPQETFVWGKGGQKKTPEQVQRDREMAQLLIQGGADYSPVDHWLQGAARMVQGGLGGLQAHRANEAETAGMERGKAAFDPILQALTGGGAPTGQASFAGAAPASVPQTADAQAIRQGLISRGLPEHVADGFLMNFQDESGLNPGINEAQPLVPGSRGGYGLYQLTGPRRVAYEQYAQQLGVDPSNVDAQLDFLMSELQGPEAAAAQSILSAPDAGSAAAAIATNFLRPSKQHLDRRVASYTAGVGNLSAQPAQPVQVASLDPSIGMPAQLPEIGPSGGPQLSPAAPAPPAPAQEIAQALMVPPQGGVAPQQASSLLPLLLQASGDPWARKQYGGIIDALMGSEMQQRQQASDPLRQLQIERATLENAQLRNPTVDPFAGTQVINGQLVRMGNGGPQVMGDFRTPDVVDPNKAPTVQKVLLEDGSEMAVQWDGASQSWIPINAPEGGGSLKPGKGMTENQAKLTLFQSLQTETQPVLLDLENQFNPGNLSDAAARSTPIAGNFFQSEQGQIYSSAATAWAEGALRIATGAAATPEEMERTKKAYFAQPGDTPNTIAFKAQMREMYNRAINNSLGAPGEGKLPLPSEFAGQAAPLAGAAGQGSYEEGTIIQDDSGRQMVMQNGQWVEVL